MSSRDIYEAVAAIMQPLPDQVAFASSNEHLSENDQRLIFSDVHEQAERDRAALLHQLRETGSLAHEREEEYDPLLDAIEDCHAEMVAAERRMRLLVAYAREFVRPQPYQLKDLARATGLSISGVRIAYDEEEVREVVELTGDKPRRAWPEPES